MSTAEVRVAFHQLESIASYPTIRLALRLILLTLVRKSQLIQATWDEVNNGWTWWRRGSIGARMCRSACLSRGGGWCVLPQWRGHQSIVA
ncbi:hypothetical protein A5892_07105 [Halotalea alkalilenta]|uniref:Uncharacterized protein n=1 Tax=Halotalea alkalilenta TaxID=376489 RepID=A0A172YDS5_9GAMM|nr:hypothetical protein A5892_07105 [Halotalea alkalilenta]